MNEETEVKQEEKNDLNIPLDSKGGFSNYTPTIDSKETKEEVKEKSNVFTHESGLRYLSIPLTSEKGDTMEIKLFESIKPERLEFENYTEYKIRRRFNNTQTKKHLKGYIFWKSKNYNDLIRGIKYSSNSWGSLTKEKAAQMINAMINKKQNGKNS